MINFDVWLNKNYNKLEDAYEDYIQMLDTTIIVPVDFTEFVEDRFEEMISDYEDMKYQEFKEKDI